jgi:dTDP-4-dehydrorhamnose reductase
VKLLVIGREGQLARSLIEAGDGIELVAVGRPELDLEQPGSAAELIERARPDLAINAAAYTAVDQAEDEPERAFRINAEAVGEIARACKETGARLIHVSTDYVFDGTASGPYAPDAATAPIGAYGRSKLAGEEAVRAQCPDHLIVRTAWVYSPFGKNFVRTMMGLAQGHETVRVVADQRGNPSSAPDLANGLLKVAQLWAAGSDAGLGATYHLAGTGIASWAEFAAEIFAECARQGLPHCTVEPIATADWPTKAARPANSALDSSAFTRDFGYAMPRWQDALKPVIGRLAQT